MIDYAAILSRKFPDTQWVLDGDNYDGLIWLSDSQKPTQKELDELWPSVKNELNAKEATRAAALAKLGLTADEIAALFG